MFQKITYPKKLEKRYEIIGEQLTALLSDLPDPLSGYANAAALLGGALADINWLGFYFEKDRRLALGPFWGLPACAYLPYGQGACWKAVLDQQPLYIPDVRQFVGHIACDSASRSELVIPFAANNKKAALDIDSPLADRFSRPEIDQLIRMAAIISNALSAQASSLIR